MSEVWVRRAGTGGAAVANVMRVGGAPPCPPTPTSVLRCGLGPLSTPPRTPWPSCPLSLSRCTCHLGRRRSSAQMRTPSTERRREGGWRERRYESLLNA